MRLLPAIAPTPQPSHSPSHAPLLPCPTLPAQATITVWDCNLPACALNWTCIGFTPPACTPCPLPYALDTCLTCGPLPLPYPTHPICPSLAWDLILPLPTPLTCQIIPTCPYPDSLLCFLYCTCHFLITCPFGWDLPCVSLPLLELPQAWIYCTFRGSCPHLPGCRALLVFCTINL